MGFLGENGLQRLWTHIENKLINKAEIEHKHPYLNMEYTTLSMPAVESWRSITYGNGKFVAVANGSNVAAYSMDGIRWTQTTMPSSQDWVDVVYGGDKFVAIAAGSNVVNYSLDGVVWEQDEIVGLPSTYTWSGITYGNNKFITIAESNTVTGIGNDGYAWTFSLTAMQYSYHWNCIVYGGDRFVAVSNTNAAYSENGTNWTVVTMPNTADWKAITYGNGKFVTVARSSKMAAYSEDGVTWTQTTMPSSQDWYAITYGNGKFVAIAYDSYVAAYSEDGITWTQTSMYSSKEWIDVAYGDGKFIAIDFSSGSVAYSVDGIFWKTEHTELLQNDEVVTNTIQSALGKRYSTSEVMTDDTWIDGKPVYRIVVEIPEIASGHSSTDGVAFLPTGIDTIISINGAVYRGSNVYTLDFETNSSSVLKADFWIGLSDGKIAIRTNSSTEITRGYVIVEYTKTADTVA